MDYKEASRIYNRLCIEAGCEKCPLRGAAYEGCVKAFLDSPDITEPILEKWAAEHPEVTEETENPVLRDFMKGTEK